MSAEVLVIGAGLGGLSAAIALAARGARVTVLEAAARAGGKAGVAAHDGVEFDTGPSLLTMPDVLDQVFACAGRDRRDLVTLRRLDPAFHYRFADGTELPIAHDPLRTIEHVRSTLGDEAALDLESFLERAGRVWSASAPSFVYGHAPSVARILRMDLRTVWGLTKIDAFRSMWGAITSDVRDPHLRTLLARYATYNGSDVRTAPATLNCISHVELVEGGWGIEGGVSAMVDALVDVARDLGVRFAFDTPVEGLALDGDRVVGAMAAGETQRADAVVANADARLVLRDWLPESLRPRTPELAPSMSGWTCMIRARRRAERVPHEVLFDEPYLGEFADLFDHDRTPRRPTVYLCAQEKAHGRRGWAEHEPVFAMVNAPPLRSGVPAAATGHLREQVLDRLRSLGRIDHDDEVVWERAPAQLAAQFPGSLGAIYGSASNNRFAAFLRPANRAPRVHGLYLASGSAHPGGGMPLCLLSGLRAAELVRDDIDLTATGVAPEPARRRAPPLVAAAALRDATPEGVA